MMLDLILSVNFNHQSQYYKKIVLSLCHFIFIHFFRDVNMISSKKSQSEELPSAVNCIFNLVNMHLQVFSIMFERSFVDYSL